MFGFVKFYPEVTMEQLSLRNICSFMEAQIAFCKRANKTPSKQIVMGLCNLVPASKIHDIFAASTSWNIEDSKSAICSAPEMGKKQYVFLGSE
ncbi:hypothetical protein CEXT_497041 [Caerostris extrusa]|uniref:Uncharacterized protein n=1 Tax=Caerostris extrusa TaxID=172846 RepID=A0AAV4P549_CAEEX|nr:hypothetical protein CEXT_497041 [Caerostris extrusa]